MKCCTISYVPSPNDPRFPTTVFLRNLTENPPAGDLILFSDHAQPDAPCPVIPVRRLDDPALELTTAMIQSPHTGELVRNPAALNNLAFFTAIGLAERLGFSHCCYLECDCRVKNHNGQAWDQVIFKSFFSYPRHLLAGGSTVVYSPYRHNRQVGERYERYLDETRLMGRKRPIPVYELQQSLTPRVFPNGAGGVYSIAGINLLFPERKNEKDTKIARTNWAWDWCIGGRAWRMFGENVFDLFGYLSPIYSGYQNVLSTEEERLQWLNDGEFCLCHQIKSSK